MVVNITVIGNISELLTEHGTVDKNLMAKVIYQNTVDKVINIKEINKSANSMQLLLDKNGKVIKDCAYASSASAYYKIVSIGKSDTQGRFMYILFTKLNAKWYSKFIGNMKEIRDYISRAPGINFDSDEIDKLCTNELMSISLIGIGGKEINSFILDPDSWELDDKGKPRQKKLAKFVPLTKAQKTRAAKNGLKLPADPVEAKKVYTEFFEKQKQTAAEPTEPKQTAEEPAEPKQTAKEPKQATEPTEPKQATASNSNEDTTSIKQTDKSEVLTINISEEDKDKPNCENENIDEEIGEMELLVTNKTVCKDSQFMQLCNELYENTLDECKVGIETPIKYASYIASIIILLKSMGKNGEKYYIETADRSKRLINIGLLDKFGLNMYIIDETPSIGCVQDKTLTRYINKTSTLQAGFTKEQLENLPSKICTDSNNKGLIFNAKIADFDLDDNWHINHIVNERIYRFPKKYSTYDKQLLWSIVKSSLLKSIRIAINDYTYASAMYDFKTGKLEYLLPIYLEEDTTKAAPLVGIIKNMHGYYHLVTVLNNCDAYNWARLLGTPYQRWWEANNPQ